MRSTTESSTRPLSGNTRLRAVSRLFLWAIAICLALPLSGGVRSAWGQSSKPATPPKEDGKDKKKDGTKAKDDRQPELWDPGDEVVPPKPLPSGRDPAAKPAGAPDDSKEHMNAEGPAWSVLVSSFTQEDHAQIASAMRDRLAARFPELRDAFVERVSHGSVILVGRFKGPDDPAAQAKLKEVKGIIADGNQRPFAGAMLTRTSTSSGPPSEFDVRRLRQRFQNVVPLYSLQVAAWSTFGDKGLKPADIRAAAEKYCKELRVKGFEAWVHHDDNTATSVVTVGHFDARAYDSKSTLYSPEVEALMKKFPRHLLNGEEALIPVDPRKPDGPKRPQGCRLVEIPR